MSQLSSATCKQIDYLLDKYGSLLSDQDKKQLVHADFDPTNILVQNINGAWKISAILDWEFSFSGSILHDIANMLRYSHQMPPSFQKYFLAGLKKGGAILPENWRITVYMINLLSLLDCPKRSTTHNLKDELI